MIIISATVLEAYLLDDGGEGNALEELVKGNGDEEGLVLIIGGHS